VIVDQTSSETAPAGQPIHGLASAQVVAMLDARLVAMNGAGKQSLARYYSSDAVFEDHSITPTVVVRGGANVAAANETLSMMMAGAGQRLTRKSDVIQEGSFAAHAIRLGDTQGMVVYELNENGKIAHQWVFGG
jgi:hypothetical protein